MPPKHKRASVPSKKAGSSSAGGSILQRRNSDSSLSFSSRRTSSGGGLHGSVSGSATADLPVTTPPSSPFRGEGALPHGKKLPTSALFFSPKTCSELFDLLTDEQLLFEVHYHHVSTTAKKRSGLITAIQKHFFAKVCSDLSETRAQVTNPLSNFSCLVEQAEAAVKELREWKPPAAPSAEQLPTLTELEEGIPITVLPTPPTPEVTDDVCKVYEDIFSSLSVTGISSELSFSQRESHGRRTCYFGSQDYSYGPITQKAKPYPDSPTFDNIFEKLKELDSTFDSDSYSCLVTLYPDGQCQIPLHSDNEAVIEQGSRILTISVGGPRTLTLQNQVGPINEATVELPHGSVYSMIRESQELWKHGILPCDSSEPRISLGFRKLCKAPEQARPKAPPIAPPTSSRVPVSIPKGSHERCLLITDSILSSTPTMPFDKIGNFRCIKKVNYKLTDIFEYESEFGISDTVIISGGLNDLSCYGMTAKALADSVLDRLGKTCKQHPNTHFVFTSILSADHFRHPWLNKEIGMFNAMISKLCSFFPNLSFFDSHHVLMSHPIGRVMSNVIDRRDARGVHLTLHAKQLITANLVKAVEFAYCHSRGKHLPRSLAQWRWPMRPTFCR